MPQPLGATAPPRRRSLGAMPWGAGGSRLVPSPALPIRPRGGEERVNHRAGCSLDASPALFLLPTILHFPPPSLAPTGSLAPRLVRQSPPAGPPSPPPSLPTPPRAPPGSPAQPHSPRAPSFHSSSHPLFSFLSSPQLGRARDPAGALGPILGRFQAGRMGPPDLRSPPPSLTRSRQPSLSLRPLTCEGSAEFTVPYQVAVPDAVVQIQPELAQLKPGYQKDAQVYKCTSCSLVDCQLPLDCPVEDVWKNEGERTALTCRVPFQTPPDVRRSWKFARDLRTQDLSLFRDLHMGAGSSLVLRPTWGSHRGTYACQLAQQDDVLARKYFYLNVTASSQEAETELQDMFHTILQSPAGHGAEDRLPGLSELLAEPDSLHKRNVVLLMVGLALSALLGTLLLGTSPARAMREEVETGARFLSRLANRHGRLDKGLVEQFGERLATILQERYCRHWYPENPAKGQAYRCIRINRRQRVDESLLRACAGCGLAYSELALPWELSLWIDPGEVCCRLGENSQYFTVSPSEGGGGKGTPEPETSDYHSESPSESSSEDEGSARPPPAPAPAPTRPALREPGKQAAELFYVPAPVWLPCTTQRLVSYIPTYQPLTFYYVSVGAKPSPAKRSNPDRLRRLTHRAAKA
ncbi:uncharacterized protein LOC125625664 isoform X2 [Caretta caretta]|uniref:uncharacterized protein LOC125625664 isoform X2 n=1 Tax=Caretta caretta TaxID=8467 RepID=UPI003F4C6C74